MDFVIQSHEFLSSQQGLFKTYREDYKVDMWLEIKKRWLIFGVLLSILLAVVSPRVGAPGGPLHSEYLSFAPLSYVYYSAGRRAGAGFGTSVTACAVTVAHAHVVVPALCALVARLADNSGLHRTLVKGALLSSAGGPCGWLSLGMSRDPAAVILLAVNYFTSLLAAPITLYVICGRAPIPALGPSLWSGLGVLPPFVAGLLYTITQSRQRRNITHLHKRTSTECLRCVKDYTHCDIHCSLLANKSTQSANNCTPLANNCTPLANNCTPLTNNCTQCIMDCTQSVNSCADHRTLLARLCVLLLLYFDCCERLREAEGSLHLADVLGTMCFALSSVSLSALWCALYCRVLPVATARTVAICAVPKALHTGWELSTACVPAGLSRLPAVFIAPAQALLLAALAGWDQPDGDYQYQSLPQ